MPKKAKELKPVQVKRLKTPGLYSVGGVAGLHMQVKDSGARSWILRVMVGDRRRNFGLGGYPDVGLAEARDAARAMRAQIRDGIDPAEARREKRDALRAAHAKALTFDQAAAACLKSKAAEFKSVKHVKQWERSLDSYASPKIGNLPVDRVELAHVVSVLEPIWTTKTETASRLRGRIETVLEWARVSGYRDGLDNPASWKTLKHVLPTPGKVRKKKHHAALPWQRMGEFMTELRKRDGMGARALELAILTATRSGEVRRATWDEIDFDAKLWVIPAERMKAKKEHRVPLSEPALKLLKKLPRMEDSPYVFPAVRGGPLSDMTLSAVPRRMHEDSIKADGDGYLDPTMNRVATPHGFRSSFRDWCAETTNYPREVAEMALAHVISNDVEAAYRRGELLAKRTKLMNAWAKFCATMPKKAAVTPIRGRRAK